eukprot:gnl/MRDRNA2_/MRDRNA2_95350_c0_seq1.p1 gnl/MRDRNA2_/MRDRNA2_95350_c0~~gnl/MRDRNA2_/MRDRNA2_95350_c0_seq1.p1  ORF type:complete len:466 (+),score=65.36 gnl/MRDRNA2_/MRDRNA2_95350_c0_seq1:56-1453(+)
MRVLHCSKAVGLAAIASMSFLTLKSINATIPMVPKYKTEDVSLLQKRMRVSKFLSSAKGQNVEENAAGLHSVHLPPLMQKVLPNKTKQKKEEICMEQEKLRLQQEIIVKLAFRHRQQPNMTQDQIFLRECRQRMMIEDGLDSLFFEEDQVKKLEEDEKTEKRKLVKQAAGQATLPSGWTGKRHALKSRYFGNATNSSKKTAGSAKKERTRVQKSSDDLLGTTQSLTTTGVAVNATTNLQLTTRTVSTTLPSMLRSSSRITVRTLSTTVLPSTTTTTTGIMVWTSSSTAATVLPRTTTTTAVTPSTTTWHSVISTSTITTTHAKTPPPALTGRTVAPVVVNTKLSNNGNQDHPINININSLSPVSPCQSCNTGQPNIVYVTALTASTTFAKMRTATTISTSTNTSTSTTTSTSMRTTTKPIASATTRTVTGVIESIPLPPDLVPSLRKAIITRGPHAIARTAMSLT